MVERFIGIIKKYGVVFLAALIVVTPALWKFAELYFSERLEAQTAQVALLREQVTVLKEQKMALEDKLRQPVDLGEASKPDANGSAPSPQVDSPAIASPRLPNIEDPARPTKQEIRELARFYGLFNHWEVNPYLRFKEGDISYWSDQGLTEEELKTEFESRQTVLLRAEKSGEKIPTQGDLSYQAEQLQAIMH